MKNIYELNKSSVNQPSRLLTENEIKTITLAFKLFDIDGTGFIKKEDLQKIFQSLGYKLTKDDSQDIYNKCQLNKGLLTLDQVQDIFQRKIDMIEECDFNGDGQINQEDFVKLMKKFKKLQK
ncbi:calmodulin [Stylonychia lemnae]|uniref:Calmodulin n=1 Tax=Stylonychia lemnae TaxID=5949 RepID=A0A078B1Y7_STYLE|nr:calmodulin [Stylonychia lemnae]|eukprot:CDW87302.1 calmodulin [Stylonychia lemnae]